MELRSFTLYLQADHVVAHYVLDKCLYECHWKFQHCLCHEVCCSAICRCMTVEK